MTSLITAPGTLNPSSADTSARLMQQRLNSLSPASLETRYSAKDLRCGLNRIVITAPEHRLRDIARLHLGLSEAELGELDINQVKNLFVERHMTFTFGEICHIIWRRSKNLVTANLFSPNEYLFTHSLHPSDALFLVRGESGTVSLVRMKEKHGFYTVDVSDIDESPLFDEGASMMILRLPHARSLWGSGVTDFPRLREREPISFELELPDKNPLFTKELELLCNGKMAIEVFEKGPGMGWYTPLGGRHGEVRDEEEYGSLVGFNKGEWSAQWRSDNLHKANLAKLFHRAGMAFSVEELPHALREIDGMRRQRNLTSANSYDMFVHHQNVVYYVKVASKGPPHMRVSLPETCDCFMWLTRMLLRLPQTNARWFLWPQPNS